MDHQEYGALENVRLFGGRESVCCRLSSTTGKSREGYVSRAVSPDRVTAISTS